MSYNPQDLDKMIDQKRFVEVEKYIIEFIFKNFETNFFIKLNVPVIMHSEDPTAYETEVKSITAAYATVFVKLFCTPGYGPSQTFLEDLMNSKEILELIFSLSAWKTTDAIIDKLGLMQLVKLKKFQFTNKRVRQFEGLLALYCSGSKYKLPWKLAFEITPDCAMKAYFGLTKQTVSLLDRDRGRGFDSLLESASEFPVLDLKNEETVEAFFQCYFACSYTEGKNKYEFKKWIAKLVDKNSVKWMSPKALSYSQSCKDKIISEKPKLGIVLEAYSTSHAMFRVFNSFFIKLKEEYQLTAFIDKKQADRSDLSVFDDSVVLNNDVKLSEVVEAVSEKQIDILFFTSIGMNRWATMLAFVRSAPIQVMAGGHPSSSYSSNIDYFLMIGKGFTAQDIQPYINETVVKIENQSDNQGYAMRPKTLTDEKINSLKIFREDADEIVVGINGVLMKVSPSLIAACQQIATQSNKKVKFIFFSLHIKNHLAYLAVQTQLSRYLKHFQLEHFKNYLDYMETLSTCHFLLPTFPFGGSNSNVDALILCKPKFFVSGHQELYTRTDEVEWVNTPVYEDMKCKDKEELIQKAVELVTDGDKRRSLYDKMADFCQPQNIFYGEESSNEHEGCSLNPHFAEIIQRHHAKFSKGVA